MNATIGETLGWELHIIHGVSNQNTIWKKTFQLPVLVAGLTHFEGHTGNGGGSNHAKARVWVEEIENEEGEPPFFYQEAYDFDSSAVRWSIPCDPALENE